MKHPNSIGLASLALVLAAAHAPAARQQAEEPALLVSREKIRAAMETQAALGYNLLASTNSTRFETSVILHIVRQAMAAEPEGPPLLLDHTDWYEAYREVTGLEPEEVPSYIALAHEYGQDRVVDFHPARTRIEIKEGFEPELVVNVRVGWPEETGAPEGYTFVDTTTSPNLRITNKRRIEYWLLDFGEIVVQDKIEGVLARPLGGALGTLFSIVGDGSAVQNRLAVAEDGLVVTYATATKGPFKVRPLTITYPDGTVETEFPKGRHDLLQLTYRIKLPLEVEYPQPE